MDALRPLPSHLRQAEFLQTQMILDALVGKTIAAAKVEETRIAVSTSDGHTFFFYGFMGARWRTKAKIDPATSRSVKNR